MKTATSASWSYLLPAVLAAALLSPAAGAQTIDPANEGYDPMRQITTQQLHPNVLLTLDRSGSLGFPVIFSSADSWGYDGSRSYAKWNFKYSSTLEGGPIIGADYSIAYSSTSFTPQSGVGHGYWLRATVKPPWSGMVRKKTACTGCGQYVYVVGNTGWTVGTTVTLSDFDDSALDGTYVLCTAPQKDSSFNNYYRFKVRREDGSCSYSFNLSALDNITIEKSGEDYYSLWYFVPPSRMAVLKNALGDSIRLYEPSVDTFGEDLNGKSYYRFGPTAGPIGGAFYDWQTKAWSGWSQTTSAPVPDPAFTATHEPRALLEKSAKSVNWGLVIYYGSSTQELVQVNPDDQGQGTVVTLLNTYMSPVASGGLNPYSGTPTSKGLNAAKASLSATYYADPRRSCGRLYATILVTDGESNTCNPDGQQWGDTCTNYATTWQKYPPGRTDELFLKSNDGTSDCSSSAYTPTTVQSFAIGVSPDVSRCELNLAAYFGRTDASAGVEMASWEGNPRLPQNESGSTSLTNFAAAPGSATLQDYAFFANNADALSDAFESIIAGLGQGDYTMSAPSVTSSPIATEGLVGFVASAAYPKWEGHLYAYDTSADCSQTTRWDCTAPCGWKDADTGRKSNCLWDAGEILAVGGLNKDGETRKGPNNGLTRRLYTWNPASASAMVPISTDAATVAQLDTLCGGCGITAEVADFMLGNNGLGTPRAWRLGAVINSTQAVVGPPQLWKQGALESHTSFENTYEERHSVVWVGSSDGFLHAFDAVDGAELTAVIDPSMLSRQVQLYENFKKDNEDFVTGQPKLAERHVYGAASSPRFGDVWFDGDDEYKTMLFMTQGPGGTGVAGIDVTHPFPGRDYNGDGDLLDDFEKADPNFGYGIDLANNPDPVKVVWSKSQANLPRLGATWSVPSLGATGKDVWSLLLGGGVDSRFSLNGSTQVGQPVVYRLDPSDGSLLDTESLTNLAGGYVLNQSFADTVLWQTNAPYFQPDNIVKQGIQVDLKGQFWILEPSQWTPSALLSLGATQPLYYPPAAAAYPSSASPSHQVYAFASGTFYERSPNITGRTSTFEPRLFLAVKPTTGSVTSQFVSIRNIPKPTGQTGNLGTRTQVTAPPLLFVAKPGSTANPFALFLVYDPDAGVCVGNSYIIKVDFNPTALGSITIPAANVYLAGAGAASGLAVAGDRVVVSRSFVGEGGRAFLQEVPNLRIPQGGMSGNISWWLELQ